MPIPNIFVFVEGKGDVDAAPILCRRVLRDLLGDKWNEHPLKFGQGWRVGHLRKLTAGNYAKWVRITKAALNSRASGILLLLDGDSLNGHCPADEARKLVHKVVADCGAGKAISVAVVFAMQEIESWFMPDADRLVGPRGGPPIELPEDMEAAPRDAKSWFKTRREGGYLPTANQRDFAERVNIQTVRGHKLRSFKRFEHALVELYEAACGGQPVATPARQSG